MFTKISKERKLKAKKYDELVKTIKAQYKDADELLDKYERLNNDSVEKMLMGDWIHDVSVEWRTLKSLLEIIERD